MSQTKAQLVAPIGVVTASGIVASGVITAASFDGNVVGSATSIISGEDITVGVISATTFSGDFTGTATGIITASDIKVGSFTASSFTGDFTGTATSMMRGTGFEAGAVNATGFVANVTGDVTGNATGLAGSVTSGANIHVGVMTATSFYGDGSNLTGIAATTFNTQTVTANSAETIIDLSNGNCITMTQSADTTVGFASTSTAMDVTIIRKDNDTPTTITWPSNIKWNGGEAPTLITVVGTDDSQQFQFITQDGGLTWYGWESFENAGPPYQLWGWGRNDFGQLGQNTAINYSSPVQIPATTWSYIGMGGDALMGYGVKSDGTAWAWGRNNRGQLGQNTAADDRSSPVQVGSEYTWSRVRGANENTFGVKTDNTLWSWGDNGSGMLGQNNANPVRYSSPVQIPGTTWDDPPWGGLWSSLVATKSDGTAWAWGSQSYGQLGVNDRTSRSSPTQIPGTTWSECRMAGTFIGVKTDGTLWTAGTNAYGSLGQGDTTLRSSPVQIPGTSWKVSVTDGSPIATTGYELFALRTDGTLWAWGYGLDGILGQNSRTSYSSPKQVGTETTWRSVDVADNCAVASKTDGTLWMWGENEQGNLGQNNKTNYSSPVQIPGTAWNHLVAGATKGLLALQEV